MCEAMNRLSRVAFVGNLFERYSGVMYEMLTSPPNGVDAYSDVTHRSCVG